jgi:hypothetical protein
MNFMPRLIPLTANLLLITLCQNFAGATPVILLDDDFTDLSQWKDLSRAVDWGNAGSPDSAFLTTGGELQLNPSATVGWTGYTNATHLRTFTAVDFQFPEPLNHSSSILTIDFRARWNRYTPQKSEGNRFLVSVQHDYPEGGIDLTDPSLVTNPAGAPWARPAYQIRIRGAEDTAVDVDNLGSTILQYGGGTIPFGEYEYYTTGGWWMPGFNSSAYGNGTHSSGAVSAPGEYSFGGPFPFNSWINTPTGLAGTYWQSFRFIIFPDRMELWRDKLEDGTWALEQTMILPALEMVPAVALNRGYYHYFEQLEGVRLYWRAGSMPSDQVYVDDVRIEAEEFTSHYDYWIHQHFTPEEIELAEIDGSLDPDADINNDGIANELIYFTGLDPHTRIVMNNLLQTQLEEEFICVQYPRSWYVYDISGGVEWSTDLVKWSTDGIVETRLEDTIDPDDPDENVTWLDSYYSRPEVVSGSWTMEALVPRPATGPIFVRLRTTR